MNLVTTLLSTAYSRRTYRTPQSSRCLTHENLQHYNTLALFSTKMDSSEGNATQARQSTRIS